MKIEMDIGHIVLQTGAPAEHAALRSQMIETVIASLSRVQVEGEIDWIDIDAVAEQLGAAVDRAVQSGVDR